MSHNLQTPGVCLFVHTYHLTYLAKILQPPFPGLRCHFTNLSLPPSNSLLGFFAPSSTTTIHKLLFCLLLITRKKVTNAWGHSLSHPELIQNLELIMVSLRRRKLLGLCAGRNAFLTPLPRFFDNGSAVVSSAQNAKSVSVHPLLSDYVNQLEEESPAKVGAGSSNVSPSSSSKDQQSQLYPGQPIKRRKRHRRKHVQNQEQCLMRGVYFKNMKWQAAIKVDKKQIHLGTVSSQGEAAHLYDRAAFMCGREPNLELPEEEKQELKKYKWDEFLAITRSAINNKKHKRGIASVGPKRSELTLHNHDRSVKQEADGSASEDGDSDSSDL